MAIIACCWAALVALAACGDDEDPFFYGDGCRFDPNGCDGDVGSSCSGNGDCVSGNCCTEEKNCGGGMCTIACNDDADCPEFMACEHDVCFFRCSSDADCAMGQSCEHGKTVCEWP